MKQPQLSIAGERTGKASTKLTALLQKAVSPLRFPLISRSIPSEKPIFEVERHFAESHLCKSQETIEIILRVGVYICDGNATRTEIVRAEQHTCAKPSYVSHPAGTGY